MSFWTRERVIGLIVGVITIILTLILIALFERHEASSQVSVCVTPEQRDHIRGVMLAAIDRALDEQVSKLFANWVVDGSGQPKRAQTGTNNAIKAHIISRSSVLAWDPHECTASFQLQSAEIRPWR